MLRIDAGDLLRALENHDPEMTHYLDRESGSVIPVFGGLFEPEGTGRVDEGDLAENPRYTAIEPIAEREVFRWMEQFAATVEEPTLEAQLHDALHHRRPFRYFEEALLGYPVERQAWLHFRDVRLLEAAHEWLRFEGIAAELAPSAAPSLQPPPGRGVG